MPKEDLLKIKTPKINWKLIIRIIPPTRVKRIRRIKEETLKDLTSSKNFIIKDISGYHLSILDKKEASSKIL